MARNEQLIRERERRGWSQARVAEAIDSVAKRVSAWERGESAPSPHFQEKLCELFGKDAEELGFVQPRTASPLLIVSREDCFMVDRLDMAEGSINLAWEAWFAARPERAAQEMLKLLDRLTQMQYTATQNINVLRAQNLRIRAHGLLGAIYLDALMNDTALHHYIQAHTLATEIHDADQAANYLALVGDALRRKDQKLDAISRMELAREQAKAEHISRTTQGHILQLLAYTHADVGNASDFETTISEATDMLSHTGEGIDAAQAEFIPFEIFEIRGKANRDLGKPLQAIPYLDLAEKSLEGQAVTPRWHALLTISRSQAFCDAGDMAVGIDLAQRGFIMARQCASPRQMNRVKKLLRKLEQGEHKNDKRIGSLRDLLYDHYLSK